MDFTKDIYINKDEILENSEIVLLYKGSLFENNKDDNVYISYGYGDLWENKSEVKMKTSTYGYLATIHIENGENLQFCFRNDNNQWDNNDGQNYILPIKESNNILEVTAIPDTRKEVDINVVDIPNPIPQVEDNLESSVVSSSTVSLFDTMAVETVSDLSSIENVQFTSTDENENIIAETISNIEENLQDSSAQNVQETVSEAETETVTLPGLQSFEQQDENSEESPVSAFSEITKQAKEQSAKAFDEDKVTAGSVYVNSIVNDINESDEENQPLITGDLYIKRSLITTDKNELTVPTFFSKIKLFFGKVLKLVKSVFTTENDEN